MVKPGATLGDVGAAVQEVVEAEGFSRGTRFCGAWHRQPDARRSAGAKLRRSRVTGMKLRAGMVIAIEPMVNAGKPDVQGVARWLDGSDQTTAA